MAQKNFADAMNQIVNGTNGVKSMINVKADKKSPALTGVPTAPTADNDTDSGQIATTEFCQNLIRRLVGSAPETLNTLAELATAINQDPDFAETIVQALDNKLNKTDAANTYLKKNDAASTYATMDDLESVTVEVDDATSIRRGIMYLYTGTGSNIDGTMTQKAITNALDDKLSSNLEGIYGSTTKGLTQYGLKKLLDTKLSWADSSYNVNNPDANIAVGISANWGMGNFGRVMVLTNDTGGGVFGRMQLAFGGGKILVRSLPLSGETTESWTQVFPAS